MTRAVSPDNYRDQSTQQAAQKKGWGSRSGGKKKMPPRPRGKKHLAAVRTIFKLHSLVPPARQAHRSGGMNWGEFVGSFKHAGRCVDTFTRLACS